MKQLYEETSCPARSIGYDRLPLSMKETGYCKIKSGYRGLVARRKIYTISYPVFSRSKMSRDRAKCWRYFFIVRSSIESRKALYHMATFSIERNISDV